MRSKIKWGRRGAISKLRWYYRFKWFWRGAALVVTFWLFNAFIYPLWVPSLSSRASNGDAFGAVNALFSGLAFAGLIYTMIMQRQELEMQRKELAAQRKEMRESRGELEEQNRIQAEQVKIRKRELMLMEFDLEVKAFEKLIEENEYLLSLSTGSTERVRLTTVGINLRSSLGDRIERFKEENFGTN